jgi:hypothetical protein
MFLIEDENLTNVQAMAAKLSRAEKQRSALDSKISEHLHHIRELMEVPSKVNTDAYRREHIELEDEFAEFTKSFRETKKAVFELTENVIHSEKIKHLLKG